MQRRQKKVAESAAANRVALAPSGDDATLLTFGVAPDSPPPPKPLSLPPRQSSRTASILKRKSPAQPPIPSKSERERLVMHTDAGIAITEERLDLSDDYYDDSDSDEDALRNARQQVSPPPTKRLATVSFAEPIAETVSIQQIVPSKATPAPTTKQAVIDEQRARRIQSRGILDDLRRGEIPFYDPKQNDSSRTVVIDEPAFRSLHDDSAFEFQDANKPPWAPSLPANMLNKIRTWHVLETLTELGERTKPWYTMVSLVAGFLKTDVDQLVVPAPRTASNNAVQPTRNSVRGSIFGRGGPDGDGGGGGGGGGGSSQVGLTGGMGDANANQNTVLRDEDNFNAYESADIIIEGQPKKRGKGLADDLAPAAPPGGPPAGAPPPPGPTPEERARLASEAERLAIERAARDFRRAMGLEDEAPPPPPGGAAPPPPPGGGVPPPPPGGAAPPPPGGGVPPPPPGGAAPPGGGVPPPPGAEASARAAADYYDAFASGAAGIETTNSRGRFRDLRNDRRDTAWYETSLKKDAIETNRLLRAAGAQAQQWATRPVATGIYYLNNNYVAARDEAFMLITSRASHLANTPLDAFIAEDPSDNVQIRVRIQFAKLIATLYNFHRYNSNRFSKLASDAGNLVAQTEDIVRYFVNRITYSAQNKRFQDTGFEGAVNRQPPWRRRALGVQNLPSTSPAYMGENNPLLCRLPAYRQHQQPGALSIHFGNMPF